MNCARNCENLLNFVKVIPKTLLVPFFSGHGVVYNCSYLGSSIKEFNYGTTANAVCIHSKLGQYYRMMDLDKHKHSDINTPIQRDTQTWMMEASI